MTSDQILLVWLLVILAFAGGYYFGFTQNPIMKTLNKAMQGLKDSMSKPGKKVKEFDLNPELYQRMEQFLIDRQKLERDMEGYELAMKSWWRDVSAFLKMDDKDLSYNTTSKKVELWENNN